MPFLITKRGTPELTYAQSRRASLRTPTRGVRTDAAARSWLDDVTAVALTLPTDAAFSHVTAAQLLGLPTPHPDARPFHVTVPSRRGTRTAVAWHQRGLSEVLTIGGVPVTGHRRTWMDLAGVLSVADLVAVTDVMLRRGLLTDLAVPPGTRGAPALRAAAALADPRSRSVRESLLRVELHQRGLPAPELNQDIIEEGEWVGCGDLVWRAYRLIIEYDGAHHGERRQRHQDAQTRNAYAEYGWECLVWTGRHFRDLPASVDQVERILRTRGWQG